METTSNLLNLHAECIPVKGSKNSIICDLNRKKYYPITNDLFDILQRFEGNSFSDILCEFDDDDQATIKEYFDYLEQLEVLHWIPVELSENFPKINLNWISSEQITNIILDWDCKKYSFKKLSLIISELEKLGCKHLQIRAYGTMDTQSFLFFFKTKISDSILRSVDLVLKYDESILGIENIWKDLGRVNSIIFHSSPFDNIEDVDDSPLKIGYIKQIIESSFNCGNIHHNYFNPSIQNVTESLKFNSCLNKKLSIDVNGEIKNCPSMAKSYGNIEDTTLAEAIDKPGFKDMWFINKDQIAVCKDCEFRYICTDCRAYIENPDDILSKPLKCGYNPYTAQWEEWSTNPLKQEAIEYYRMQELRKKEELK